MNGMTSLLESMIYTKGWEYIIAIVFVFAWIAFWRLVWKDKSN